MFRAIRNVLNLVGHRHEDTMSVTINGSVEQEKKRLDRLADFIFKFVGQLRFTKINTFYRCVCACCDGTPDFLQHYHHRPKISVLLQ